MAEIRSVGVVGGGQMGSGIAQLAAVNGLEVWLHDSDPTALSKAHQSISSTIQSLVSKGRLTKVLFVPILADPLDFLTDNFLTKEKGAEAVRKLKYTSSLEDFGSVDIVIEAIVESEEVKKKLFTLLDSIVKESAILASNTSSISITRLASATSRPTQEENRLHYQCG
ncbi:UNVERIFIED_CONTAM: putative 3-hydroxybutyryl-CoA dehydrogenase [Sesamum radiatum]|uniref:3-hydroxybutyryl-CoA dehydrogenase n=1 Tax=Sesamum radiatum TaxID=300843 RepID=A0AAW2KJB2_SESRA